MDSFQKHFSFINLLSSQSTPLQDTSHKTLHFDMNINIFLNSIFPFAILSMTRLTFSTKISKLSRVCLRYRFGKHQKMWSILSCYMYIELFLLCSKFGLITLYYSLIIFFNESYLWIIFGEGENRCFKNNLR